MAEFEIESSKFKTVVERFYHLNYCFFKIKIIEKIENNERLRRPENCSVKSYTILSKCWFYDCDARPSFQVLTKLIREV